MEEAICDLQLLLCEKDYIPYPHFHFLLHRHPRIHHGSPGHHTIMGCYVHPYNYFNPQCHQKSEVCHHGLWLCRHLHLTHSNSNTIMHIFCKHQTIFCEFEDCSEICRGFALICNRLFFNDNWTRVSDGPFNLICLCFMAQVQPEGLKETCHISVYVSSSMLHKMCQFPNKCLIMQQIGQR